MDDYGDLVKRLRHVATTLQNDDRSKPMTEQRDRHIERFDTILDGADAIESLQLLVKMKPAPEVREDSALIAEAHQLRAQLAAPLPEEVEAMMKELIAIKDTSRDSDVPHYRAAVLLRSLARQVAELERNESEFDAKLTKAHHAMAESHARAERAEAERDRYHDALIARHGGEPIALLAELDEARRERDALRKALQYAIDIHTPGRIDGPTHHHVAMFLQQANAIIAHPPPSAAAANSDRENVRE